MIVAGLGQYFVPELSRPGNGPWAAEGVGDGRVGVDS